MQNAKCKIGRGRTVPTGEIDIFCFGNRRMCSCDQSDLGRIISSPTTTLFIFYL